MCEEEGGRTYLSKRDIFAKLELHQVLLPVHDLDRAVRLYLPDVSRLEPPGLKP
jgi:hypothetical protein